LTADVHLDGVTVRFGPFTAVDHADLRIAPGEFFSFLGPSGCGKTTILRTISGFIEPSEGAVRIGGRDMAGIGANKRPTALIFQNLALFPMMSVADNVGYGLRVRGQSRRQRQKRVDELLDLVALGDQGRKMVDELSGGQRQRVAIARALAVEPQVLLLDEPLSALDLKLRQHMRRELRAIQQRVGLTFIYITHDQGEALTMSDRIAVMNHGRIEQVADGRTIYDHPHTEFVASFVGETNALAGRVSAMSGDEGIIDTELGALAGRNPRKLARGSAAKLFIRPEALRPANEGIAALVTSVAYEGNLTHVALMAGHVPLIMLLGAGDGVPPPDVGDRLTLGITHATILPVDHAGV
jgi:spermidine/putrescine transport system ATP-binding protein